MRGVKFLSLLLLATLALAPLGPLSESNLDIDIKQNASSKSTGVDLTVNDVSFSYPSTSEQLKYQMFSSNHPIVNFDKPKDLFVVDAVIDVPITIDFTVSNLGTTSSGNFNVIILISHNEYSDFELHNESVLLNSINGGNSATGQKTITPTYSGNHTLQIFPVSSVVDDNPNNDELTRSFTVAYSYFNCDDFTGWSTGTQWSSNSDTALSQGFACHVGNGQSSTYSNNLNTALITPTMDMSNAVDNPTRTNGITFFYTGSILTGDVMKIYVTDSNGIWNEMASISGTIDQVFTDGANWQTWSINHAGAQSPLIPVQQQYFHSQTQFKFEFTSDSVNNDIGLWMDDIVIVYDQKVKQKEYGLTVSGISSNGAVPGSWGKATVEITNTGNITETFTPTTSGLPANWNLYYSTTTGVSINPAYGITLMPGESKQFDINFQPDSMANQGLYQVTFTANSNQYNMVQSQLNMQFQVIPDRIPEIILPSSIPSCQPGNTCTFEVGVTNIGGATDVFDIQIDSSELPLGWSVALAWSQPISVLSQPGIINDILMTYTVPSDALPDSIGKFDLKIISQNDSSRIDVREIELTASMISDAYVEMELASFSSNWTLNPGETREIYYTISNNASSQDIFLPSISVRDLGLWVIEQPTQTNMVINSGKQSMFSISITAPEQSQVGDVCPKITPEITSTRSGSVFSGVEFDEIEVSRRDDLIITLIDEPEVFNPGIPNLVNIEIENNGNGPNDANLELIGIPNDWSWELFFDGEIISNPISLSAIYDLDDVKEIQIAITPNSTTLAGSLYQYVAKVSSYDGTFDNNQSDNQIELQATISTNHNIVINTIDSELFSGISNTTLVRASIQNLGNIVENNVLIRAQISSLDTNLQLNPYFTIGGNGIIFELDEFHMLNLNIGQKYDLEVGFIIPENTEIGTKFVVNFDVQSNNGTGLIFQTSQTMIDANYRRSMVVDLYSQNLEIIDESLGARALLNLTSTSTVDEIYTIKLALPENWQAVCSGIILSPNGTLIENSPGYVQEQFTSTSCEMYPLDGEDSGEVVFSITNEDGTLIWTESKSYTFERNIEDSFSLSSNMIAGSIAGVLAIAILSIIILKFRNNDDEVGEETEIIAKTNSGPPISGPPVSTFQDNNNAAITNNPVPNNIIQQPTDAVAFSGPPIPDTGLPVGWTHEQWQYYGQKYLDKLNSGGN